MFLIPETLAFGDDSWLPAGFRSSARDFFVVKFHTGYPGLRGIDVRGQIIDEESRVAGGNLDQPR